MLGSAEPGREHGGHCRPVPYWKYFGGNNGNLSKGNLFVGLRQASKQLRRGSAENFIQVQYYTMIA